MPDRLNPITHQSHGPNTWCSLCERTYPTPNWVAKSWHCPTPGCPASAVHSRPWREVRNLNPRYPEHPESGGRYSFSDPSGGL